jgi:ABC-2 type transport system permease protein
MNRFILITKIQLLNLFRAQKGKKARLNLGTYEVGAMVMFCVGIYYSMILFNAVKPAQYASIPLFMTYIATFMVFIMGISTSRGMLFGFKDLDVLKAMPFTEREIVFSKIAVFTLTEYLYNGAFILPVAVIYGVYAGASVLYYILALFGFLVFPLLPVAIASLLGMGLERISAGKKHADAIRNGTSVLVFLLIYGVSMYLSFKSGGNSANTYLNMNQYLGKFMFVSEWYMKGAIEGNVLLVLASMAVSILGYVLFLYFYSGKVMQINAIANQGYHVENFHVKKIKSNGVFKALYLKEQKRFFHNFLYVFNTAFGMFLLVGVSVYIMFKRNAVLDALTEIIQQNSSFGTLIAQLFVIGIVFFGQMTCTTSSSISLEGKSLWIMKTLPVSVNQVFWSKMMVNILLILLPSTLSLVLLGIDFGFGILYYITGLVFIAASSLGISMFGLLVNLALPKLVFENEQEVIKQSAAAFLAVMVPMFLGIGLIGLFLLMNEDIPNLFYLILSGYIVADIIMYCLLKWYGTKKYLSLN